MQVFRDAAISGSTGFRPNYQALSEAATKAEFDIVVAEALDRLSRDQEDVAGLFKRMQFAGVRIITLAEGEISELHVGLKGTMNALFLKDLAQKTHRGQRGRIEAGKSAGGRCYGYDIVRRTDERGELVRGERAIDSEEAAVVQRIFSMFAAGASPITIAKALNHDGIPGPAGHDDPWARATRHRDLAERALHRPAGLEPADLYPQPSNRASGVAGEPRRDYGDGQPGP